MLQELSMESKMVELSASPSKTKIRANGNIFNINIVGKLIEYVTEFIWVGQAISFKDTTEKELNQIE